MRIKRSFLLIEVLIAFTLVALFAPFMMRYPVLHYREQVDRLEDFERRRISDWTFSEVKELLLKKTIPWERLPGRKKGEQILPLSSVELEIPGILKRTLSRSFSLKCLREKQGKQGRIFRLYKVGIRLGGEKEPFFYKILVQREPPQES